MTPTWLELQEWVEENQELSEKNVRVAKVECTMNEDLCKDLIGFPTIRWYEKGTRSEKECDERELGALQKCILDRSQDLPVIKTTESNSMEKAYKTLETKMALEIESNPNVNPEGKMIHLNDQNFYQRTAQGPWLLVV